MGMHMCTKYMYDAPTYMAYIIHTHTSPTQGGLLTLVLCQEDRPWFSEADARGSPPTDVGGRAF